jgi:hypothetical protein
MEMLEDVMKNRGMFLYHPHKTGYLRDQDTDENITETDDAEPLGPVTPD